MAQVENIRQSIMAVEQGLRPFVRRRETDLGLAGHIDLRMQQLHVQGLSCAIVNRGEIHWAKQYGVLKVASATEVSIDTQFNACSISKLVTATLVLILVGQGQLALDEDVNRYLVSWNMPVNQYTAEQPVTVRHLLSHQSGIVDGSDSFGPLTSIGCAPSNLEILQASGPYNRKPVQAEYRPGSKFEYCDAGYCVIEQLLSDVTGQSLDKLAQQLLFTPLGMDNSHFQLSDHYPDDRAMVSAHNKHGQLISDGVVYPYMAGSGLWSTPSDLCLLAIELGQQLQGEGKLATPVALARDMFSGCGAQPWAGLGVFLDTDMQQLNISSLGWGVGAQSMLLAFPNINAAIVVMINTDLGCHQHKAIIGELIRSAINHYQWPVSDS